MYGIPVELDGEDDDLEGEQSGDNMEGKHGVLWDFGKSPPPTHPFTPMYHLMPKNCIGVLVCILLEKNI